MNASPLFAAVALTKHFGGLRAVEGVSLEVAAGEIVALIGPNGAGKTTCFNLFTGVDEPTSGDVRFEQRSLVGLAPWQVAQAGIARTFQNVRLFREMTVLDNVRTPCAHRAGYGVAASVLRTASFRRCEAAVASEAEGLLELVGLSSARTAVARELCYGDQRRLEVARALALRPRLLLLDEPAAGMNPSEKVALAGLVRGLRDAREVTVLLIEHDMKFVMDLADRIYVLDHGERIAEGTPAEVRADPRVIEAYLGAAPAADGGV